MTTYNPPAIRRAGSTSGFTLIELLVAMTLGLLLIAAMGYVYLTSKSSFSRQQQLSTIQQSVRTAFEYLSSDARMVGHLGCNTTPAAGTFTNMLSTTDIKTNFGVGIEGYEYQNASTNAYTLSSAAPNDVTTASNWATNVATAGVNTIPVSAIAGTGNGLTPGSDVLVIRTVSGRPVRLAANANTGANQPSFTIETMASGGDICANGTATVSGFCRTSYGLIASCTQARVFQLTSITAGAAPAASTLSLAPSNLGGDPLYSSAATEVFPMQTIVYYVKKSASGTSTSLYRRIFDGDKVTGTDAGLEQELIEGVENMQLRYGVDTTATPDGVVDAYVAARGPAANATDSVTDWSRVVSVRMGLLIRSTAPIEGDMASALPTTGLVNGVTVTYPTSSPKYDRRVFTTTVALREPDCLFLI